VKFQPFAVLAQGGWQPQAPDGWLKSAWDGQPRAGPVSSLAGGLSPAVYFSPGSQDAPEQLPDLQQILFVSVVVCHHPFVIYDLLGYIN
jgi:hypothetical protein